MMSERRLTRREFVKGLAGPAGLAALSDCSKDAFPILTPTSEAAKVPISPSPTKTPEPTAIPTLTPTLEPIPELNAIALESFTNAWNKEKQRLEYLDVDGKAIAYWDAEANEGKGRVEITYAVDDEGLRYLDLEKHKGLFVTWDAAEAEKEFLEIWKAEGEFRLPLPLTVDKGLVKIDKGFVDLICFPELAEGVSAYVPFSSSVESMESENQLTKEKKFVYIFTNHETNCQVWFMVKGTSPFVRDGMVVKAGTKAFEAITDQKFGLAPAGRRYEFAVAVTEKNGDKHNAKDMNFERLMKDEFGRVVRISGAPQK